VTSDEVIPESEQGFADSAGFFLNAMGLWSNQFLLPAGLRGIAKPLHQMCFDEKRGATSTHKLRSNSATGGSSQKPRLFGKSLILTESTTMSTPIDVTTAL